MKLADWITLAVVAAVIAAFVLGRRNAKRAVANALAAARAEGHAEATAAAQSTSTSGVFIGGGAGDLDSLASAVAGILTAQRPSLNNVNIDHDDQYDRTAIHDSSGVSGRRALSAANGGRDYFGVGAMQAAARLDPIAARTGRAGVVTRGHRGSERDVHAVEAKEGVTDADAN